jgi:hypothetical protein
MHYEVWTTSTGNLVADCDSEVDALAVARDLLAAGWSADHLAVALERDAGEELDDTSLPPPLGGAELAARIQSLPAFRISRSA